LHLRSTFEVKSKSILHIDLAELLSNKTSCVS